jgi:hypothetical protein
LCDHSKVSLQKIRKMVYCQYAYFVNSNR